MDTQPIPVQRTQPIPTMPPFSPLEVSEQQRKGLVQAIEARLHGELRVKPLQEHARDLDLYGVGR